MNKTKFRSISIAALTLLLALVMCFAFGSLFVKTQKVSAQDYRPTEIFSEGTKGKVGVSKAGEGEKSYLRFSLSDEGEVYFRRDLALKWYAPVPADKKADASVGNPAEKKYYSMQFAFAPAEYETTADNKKTCPRCGESLASDVGTCTKCNFDFAETIFFDRYEIAFESAEENYSKKGVSTNTIVIEPEGENLKFAVRNSYGQPDEDKPEEEDDWTLPSDTVGFPAKTENFTVTFSEDDCESGEFAVHVNGQSIGKFTNVGGYYMEYLSSASATPRDPMTFRAELPEETNADYKQVPQVVKMISLNGQSFEVNPDGKVYDNTDAVLVINEAIYAYTLGRKWSLTYEAIDVCDSSVSTTRRYAMVNAPDGEDENGEPVYPKPLEDDYKALTTSTVFMPTSDDQTTEQYVSIYFKLDDGTVHRHKCPDCGYIYDDNEEETPFAALPSDGDDAWKCPGTKDGSSCGADKSKFTTEDNYVYLTWYAANDAQIASLNSSDVYECKICGKQYHKTEYDKEDFTKCTNTDDEKHKNGDETVDALKGEDFKLVEVEPFDYILVNRGDIGSGAQNGEKSGPKYIGLEVKDSTDGQSGKVNGYAEDAEKDEDDLDEDGDTDELLSVAKYQKTIDEIAYETEDGDGAAKRTHKLSAGDGSYFYLPSLRELIASENADYRNLRFSVYYKKPRMEGSATASSATSLRYNALRFEIDEEGKYIFKVLAADAAGNAMKYALDGKVVTVSSSNIWDIEEIPTFEFEVTYTGATVKDLTDSYQGYRDSSYTITSFDIVALSGYKAEYELYRFDDFERAEKGLEAISYDTFRENPRKYFTDYADCLKLISEYNSEITEDDPRWDDTSNKYHWDPDSSLSFIPKENTFYVVKLEVTEDRLPGYSVDAFQVIDVRNTLDSRPDPTYWLENNVTSVVLFSISGALLVIIIILFIVKPSDKKIEEVDVSTLRGGKNKNNNKKNKKKE